MQLMKRGVCGVDLKNQVIVIGFLYSVILRSHILDSGRFSKSANDAYTYTKKVCLLLKVTNKME